MSPHSCSLQSKLCANFRRHIRGFAEHAASSVLQSPRVRGLAFDALHLLTDTASVNVSGIQYAFSTNDWIIGRSLYISGHWDDEFMEAAVKLLAERRGSRPLSDGVFIDVGANIGTTTIQALTKYQARRVIAVEPSPKCLPLLYTNLAANRLSDRCDVIEAVLSDASGEAAFRSGENNSGAGEVVPLDSARDYTVKSEVLDHIIPSLGIDFAEVSLVWVDTEGHEYRVLSGAKRVIDSGIPVVIEFWPQKLRENGDFAALVEMLADTFKTIIDIRAHVQVTRESVVESSVDTIRAHAETLGPWPTDLLLLP